MRSISECTARIASELPAGEDNNALAWHTQVNEREDDAIELHLDPTLDGPEQLSFRIKSRDFTGLLVLAADDEMGRRYIFPEPIVAAPGQWGQVQANLADFVLQDTGGLAEGKMQPGTVVRVVNS